MWPNFVFFFSWKKKYMCVCVCVCVCERERESVCVLVLLYIFFKWLTNLRAKAILLEEQQNNNRTIHSLEVKGIYTFANNIRSISNSLTSEEERERGNETTALARQRKATYPGEKKGSRHRSWIFFLVWRCISTMLVSRVASCSRPPSERSPKIRGL